MTTKPEVVDTRVLAKIAQEIGSSIMPDNKVWVNRFTVESLTSSSTYTVAQRRTDGVWGCSCRGWINYRHCKHLKDILHRLATVESTEAAARLLASARTAFLDLSEAVTVAAPKAKSNRLLDLR